MNELTAYLFKHLDENFEKCQNLSESAISTLALYQHKDTEKKVLLLKTNNRNDEVYRTLNRMDTQGFLPQVYIVASDDDALYVLQEYVKGRSAAEIIGSNDSSVVIGYAIDVCHALKILHALGVVHRDIKPDNVIIKEDGHACLIDLSIAKMIGSNSDTVNLGTVGYAAPEQFGFTASRAETDIYAFGVMLNILLTGVHPSRDMPDGKIGKIIKKCTSLKMADRYANIDSLLADLEKCKRHKYKENKR